MRGATMLALAAVAVVDSGSGFLPPFARPRCRQRNGGAVHRQRRRDTDGRYRRADDAAIESWIECNRKFLRETLGFSEGRLDKISSPSYSGYNILALESGVLRGRVDWLRNRLDLNRAKVGKMAQLHPQILTLRSEANLAPKIEYLERRLLLDEESLRKLIAGAPIILQRNTEEHLEPTMDWLQWRLDLDDAALRKFILRSPTVLCLNVDTNIEPSLRWFQQRFDLEDNAALGKLMCKSPTLITRNVTLSVEPNVNWLQKRLGWNNATLSKMVKQNPTILTYNVDRNLEPTLNFYIDALESEEEALALVIRQPRLFSSSLDKRLRPRLEQARDAGIGIDVGCLQRLARYTDGQWERALPIKQNNWDGRNSLVDCNGA